MKTTNLIILATVASLVCACGDEPPRPQVHSAGDEPVLPPVTEEVDYTEHQRTRERVIREPVARPSQADADRRTEWGMASVVDSITIVELGSCCADLDGDTYLDNAMGALLRIWGIVEDPQSDVEVAIGAGEMALLFEYEGLDASRERIDLHIARGVPSPSFVDVDPDDARPYQPNPDGGNTYVVDPRTVDAEDRITTTLEASYEDGLISSRGGTFTLPFTLWNIPFDMELRHVQLTAKVDESVDADGGTQLALRDGTLAGVVHVVDVYDGLNDFVWTHCACLGVEGDLFDYSGPGGIHSPECVRDFTSAEAAALCVDDPSVDTDDLARDCAIVAHSFCDNITSLAFSLDMNTEDPSLRCIEQPAGRGAVCDGLSVAFEFTAAGATIEGVADVD